VAGLDAQQRFGIGAGALALFAVLQLVVYAGLLVLALGLGERGSMIGFDLARTFNPPNRQGIAAGMVNVGGFVASLVSILLVGLILDARTGGTATYGIDAFKLAMSVQYLVGAVGLIGVLRTRRLARRRLLVEEGIVLRPVLEVLAERTRGVK